MHVCVFTHFNLDKLDAIQNKENQIDHIHSDPSDNRIESLRLVTRVQNIAARRPPKKRSRGEGGGSAFKGVSRKKNSSKWVAEYTCKERMVKRMRCAAMPTAMDAANLYNRIVSYFQPAFGYLNDTTTDGVGCKLTSDEIEDKFQSMLATHRESGLLL
jgi:hypothetical protein